MTLSGHSDLKRLANPPGCVGGQTSSMADVKTIDGLHQATDRFLEKIGVAESVVAESFGDVSSETNVGGSEAMLEVDVAIMEAADGGGGSSVFVGMFADELGHRPGFKCRSLLAQSGEVSYQHANQLAFSFPEIGEERLFFLRRQQVRREDGGRCHDRLFLGDRLALAASRLYCHFFPHN